MAKCGECTYFHRISEMLMIMKKEKEIVSWKNRIKKENFGPLSRCLMVRSHVRGLKNKVYVVAAS